MNLGMICHVSFFSIPRKSSVVQADIDVGVFATKHLNNEFMTRRAAVGAESTTRYTTLKPRV